MLPAASSDSTKGHIGQTQADRWTQVVGRETRASVYSCTCQNPRQPHSQLGPGSLGPWSLGPWSLVLGPWVLGAGTDSSYVDQGPGCWRGVVAAEHPLGHTYSAGPLVLQ